VSQVGFLFPSKQKLLTKNKSGALFIIFLGLILSVSPSVGRLSLGVLCQIFFLSGFGDVISR
jgi:hypothetical protein